MAIADIETLDREAVESQSKGVIDAEKQCRITLSPDATRRVELEWNPGGKNGRRSVIPLEPGKSVIQPLSKAQVWFGPFAVPLEYAETTDESKKEALRKFWATEKMRYLTRYDYPRGNGRGQQPDMMPVGPHRSPDVTCTIIEADGSEHEPIRLHQLYKIGEFDELKDQFTPRESAADIEARYESELSDRDKEIAGMRRQMAEMAGMIKGIAATSGSK